ncbi:MAG TPA: S8 family serine peptidase, partial [Gemmatimonadaceae bacterium]|nr:S8 family serine peptidase [Gemmatimonadaceae bacterium]
MAKQAPHEAKAPSAPAEFQHPTFGRCMRDPTRAAIRWRARAGRAAKEKLLDEARATFATLAERTERPLIQVNQTEGLSWIQSRNGEALSAEQFRTLEASELVEWVASAYRAERADPAIPALFAVNPARLYIRDGDVDVSESIAALRMKTSLDPNARSHLRGYHTLRIEEPKMAEGGAIETLRQLSDELSRHARGHKPPAVRLENIPFISPATHVATPPFAHAVHDWYTAHAEHCQPPTTEFTPNDPDFGIQWGLQRINAPRGWELMRGSPSVTVAVLDEGVELAHPDLDVHAQSWNASTDAPDGSPTGNHGTACAGIIGARLDNMAGVAGVAGGCRTMAIATATWADVDIAEGLYFAADNGAHVVSMSFGVYPSWMMWDFDLIRDALQHAHEQGLVLVAATGNEDIPQSRFPGSDARTIAVGGSNRTDERKRVGDSSSEPFWGACFGNDIDVVAPCLEIPTTDRLGGSGYAAGDYFDGFNGTSAATPHVAGLAALIFSMRPNLTNVQVRSLIESTCDKISPNTYVYGHVAHKTSGTWNAEVGYGRINVERALLAACALVGGDGDGTCSGCGGTCIEDIPADCRGPSPVPWLAHDACMYFYETRTFGATRFQIRITYEHCLRLLGRQQGPLLYTQSLLPGEEVRLFYFDRYRRVRSQTERLSVHASFRQTVSALSQARRSASASAYAESLSRTRKESDASISVGGGLAGFFGAPSGDIDVSTVSETTLASGASARTASETFVQFATTASQAVEAERSIVISTFEEEENRSTTQRTFRNDNKCYAVTYYIRRVNEVYEATTRVLSVEWRTGSNGPFRSVHDINGLTEDLRLMLRDVLREAPPTGERQTDRRRITIPTDGTLFEAELAYCSSCEPIREAELRMELEQKRLDTRKLCVQTEALAFELERRPSLVVQAASLGALGSGATGALPAVSASAPALAGPGAPQVG